MKRTPRCLGCGYDLSGLTDGPVGGLKIDVRCPECNRYFIAAERRRPRGKLWMLLAGNFLAVLVVFAVIPQDACGGPGMGYVGVVAWMLGALTLAVSVEMLRVQGYGRTGSGWIVLTNFVAFAIALPFVSMVVAMVKLALSRP